MSLSAEAREDLLYLVCEDDFLPAAEQALKHIIAGKKQDDSRNKNRKESLKSIDKLNGALFNLTDEAREYLDRNAAVDTGFEHTCDALLAATRDNPPQTFPKQNTSKARSVLKTHIRMFIRNGWLEAQPGESSLLCEVVEILINEAGITHNAHRAVRDAISEMKRPR